MRVLGIDPGTATLGWGVIDHLGSSAHAIDFGALTTPSGAADHERLKMLFDGLNALLDTLEPDAAAVEKLYFGQNSRTAMVVGQARGIVLLVLAQHGVPYVEMSPAEVKQAVTGYGRAEKRQVQLMVQRLLGLSTYPRPDDAADALAIAICGAEHIRFQKSSGVL
ncbi:MAG: crossover junction endodeoxyribonuclease RuvC [Sulfobacillus acidophilus]|uniref:Crossover junction endodeoxyribonuclease RuvC n=1 Tax=Sulfobacillus acidophilus TaxID=53633 RepID=A0A2T2WFX4_9FIRM|nr:MAG: crossover junction endodeoxyribonuclease RuvC [Sulfobacillus acidophilus]